MNTLLHRTALLLSARLLGTALLTASFCLGVCPDAIAAPAGVTDKQAGEQAPEETPDERRERIRREAEERRQQRQAELEQRNARFVAMYDELAAAYVANEFDRIPDLYRQARQAMSRLSREQRMAVQHINEWTPQYRPDWWENTGRQTENSFEAEIWGREFWANYVPTDELGLQVVLPRQDFNPDTGQLEIVDLVVLVTWQPQHVDSDVPAEGALAVHHGYTLGDIAEIIIWHELGHNYITENVPMRDNIMLYSRHGQYYATVHEYFADMTAIYHASPRARRIALQLRLDGLDYYSPRQQHCRASHGIGALLLADMLENPDAWPSVHFPPSVPEQQVEVNTIIYIYENLGTEWSAQEDIRLQEIARTYIMEQGQETLTSQGDIELANGQMFNLMFDTDRQYQGSRDEWVSEKLTELIAQGRADTLEDGETYDPPQRSESRRRRGGGVTVVNGRIVEDPDGPPRIELPWAWR